MPDSLPKRIGSAAFYPVFAVAIGAHVVAAGNKLRDLVLGVAGMAYSTGFRNVGTVEHFVRRCAVILVGHVRFAWPVTRCATDPVRLVRRDQQLAVEVKMAQVTPAVVRRHGLVTILA